MKTENVDPMNTEQLKTAHMMLQEAKEDLDNVCLATKYVLEDDVILNLMDQFASQESKIAVEKDHESRWISREDRLPEGKDANRLGEVISLDDKGIPTTIHFNNVIMFEQYSHWQTLPEPPKL